MRTCVDLSNKSARLAVMKLLLLPRVDLSLCDLNLTEEALMPEPSLLLNLILHLHMNGKFTSSRLATHLLLGNLPAIDLDWQFLVEIITDANLKIAASNGPRGSSTLP